MVLENDLIRIEVQKRGGSLVSIFDKTRKEECLYQPLPDSWQGQDIFIFPFIGRLIDKTYTIDGDEYHLDNHGLLRYMDAVLSEEDERLVASFRSDEQTLVRYPFPFLAEVTYSLSEKTISLDYRIENRSDRTMPFMFGAHPAFKVIGRREEDEFDMNGNTISFDGSSEKRILLQDETFSFMTEREAKISSPIRLSKGLFNMINTIIIDASDMSEVSLNKRDGSKIIVHISGAPYVAIWSDRKYGDYVCIEPWFGYPDTIGAPKELYKKPGIRHLEPQGIFKFRYQIEIC